MPRSFCVVSPGRCDDEILRGIGLPFLGSNRPATVSLFCSSHRGDLDTSVQEVRELLTVEREVEELHDDTLGDIQEIERIEFIHARSRASVGEFRDEVVGCLRDAQFIDDLARTHMVVAVDLRMLRERLRCWHGLAILLIRGIFRDEVFLHERFEAEQLRNARDHGRAHALEGFRGGAVQHELSQRHLERTVFVEDLEGVVVVLHAKHRAEVVV